MGQTPCHHHAMVTPPLSHLAPPCACGDLGSCPCGQPVLAPSLPAGTASAQRKPSVGSWLRLGRQQQQKWGDRKFRAWSLGRGGGVHGAQGRTQLQEGAFTGATEAGCPTPIFRLSPPEASQ